MGECINISYNYVRYTLVFSILCNHAHVSTTCNRLVRLCRKELPAQELLSAEGGVDPPKLKHKRQALTAKTEPDCGGGYSRDCVLPAYLCGIPGEVTVTDIT